LADIQTSKSFQLQCSGTDEGSGIRDYTIFVSEDGGPFAEFVINTTDTSANFEGQFGKTYAFYSVARDQTGNIEVKQPVSEAFTPSEGETVLGRRGFLRLRFPFLCLLVFWLASFAAEAVDKLYFVGFFYGL